MAPLARLPQICRHRRARSNSYCDYPAALSGRAVAGTMPINDPRADSNFKTIEAAGTKRLSQNWQFSASPEKLHRSIRSRDVESIAVDSTFRVN